MAQLVQSAIDLLDGMIADGPTDAGKGVQLSVIAQCLALLQSWNILTCIRWYSTPLSCLHSHLLEPISLFATGSSRHGSLKQAEHSLVRCSSPSECSSPDERLLLALSLTRVLRMCR